MRLAWYWRLLIGFLVLIVLPQIFDNFPYSDNVADQPPLPMPTDRVRRPLPQPSAEDPLFTIEDEPLGADEAAFGTSFPVAPGLWLTARHVANDSCNKIFLLIQGKRVPATLAYVHPESDLTLLKSATPGGPSLALESGTPEETDFGYTVGFPSGSLGATQDELMGRARMTVTGATHGTGPALSWAEVKRFPDSLKSLGGMSGGPMLDSGGKIVGIMVAASVRRGRIDTVAPEVLRATAQSFAFNGRDAAAAPASEIPGDAVALDAAAIAFSRNNQVVKTYCVPLGTDPNEIRGLRERS